MGCYMCNRMHALAVPLRKRRWQLAMSHKASECLLAKLISSKARDFRGLMLEVQHLHDLLRDQHY